MATCHRTHILTGRTDTIKPPNVFKFNWATGSPPKFDTLMASWYPTRYMRSFRISHSSCGEQYGDTSSDTQTYSHTIRPPTAGVWQVSHISITLFAVRHIHHPGTISTLMQQCDHCTATCDHYCIQSPHCDSIAIATLRQYSHLVIIATLIQ